MLVLSDLLSEGWRVSGRTKRGQICYSSHAGLEPVCGCKSGRVVDVCGYGWTTFVTDNHSIYDCKDTFTVQFMQDTRSP